MTDPIDPTRPLGPEQVEQLILAITNDIVRGVPIVTSAHDAFLKARRAYKVAYATAYMEYKGSQGDKRYAADLACQVEEEARDVAEVAYQHAKNTAEALRDRLNGVQSVGASVREVFKNAGRGEW